MIPLQTRKLVLARAKAGCEDCEESWNFAIGFSPELHHLHYNTVGNESPEDLAVLCRECHYGRHMAPGGFERDPEIVEDQWECYLHALWKDD